eukprot:m51a1_g2232 hypothetical protein (488) ;mRNA; r:246299-248369
MTSAVSNSDQYQLAEALPRWSYATRRATPTPSGPSSAPIVPRFPEGPFLELVVDALACPTNETASDTNTAHEAIRQRGGEQLQLAMMGVTPLRMGEARITPAAVVHTVGPRYNARYVTAAVNSLNRCYLNSLQAAVDAGLRSVAFLPIHTPERNYPLELGAHVACRTIRRFLEHFPDKLSVIVLCLGKPSERSLYLDILRLYMPRDDLEALAAESMLPKDTGNEWGEETTAERSIRIGALPGMGADDSDYGSDEDEAPSEVHKPPPSLVERMQNPDTRAELVLAAAPAQHAQAPQQRPRQQATKFDELPSTPYNDMLKAAATEDLRDVEALQVVYRAGVDADKRPIVVIAAHHLPVPVLPLDKFLRYMCRVMDDVAEQPYTLVYLHSVESDNQPGVSWIRSVYTVFPEKYQRNMIRLVVVYPTFWLRLLFSVSNTFYISLPVQYVSDLAELYRQYDARQLMIPFDIAKRDPALQMPETTAGTLHEDL